MCGHGSFFQRIAVFLSDFVKNRVEFRQIRENAGEEVYTLCMIWWGDDEK